MALILWTHFTITKDLGLIVHSCSCNFADVSLSLRYYLYLPQMCGKNGELRLIAISAQDITDASYLYLHSFGVKKYGCNVFEFIIPVIYVNYVFFLN